MQLIDVMRLYAAGRDMEVQSLKSPRAAIGSLSLHLGQPATIAHLRPDVINPWLAAELIRVKRRTARNNRASILTLWKWCYEIENSTEVPPLRVRPIKAPLAPVEAYTQEEVEALLLACDTLTNRFCRFTMPRAFIYRALVLTSWHTGFRPHDMMQLRWSNVAANGCVRIIQSKTSGPVTRWIDQDAMAALEAIHQPGVELIFGRLTCVETWREVFKTLKKTAGIKRGTPKWLRRATATRAAIDFGEEAAGKVLGHKTAGMAKKHYIDQSQLLADQLRLARLRRPPKRKQA